MPQSQTLTIARRELASLFFSPIGYVVLGLFALGSVMIFFLGFAPGAPATLRATFGWILWLMVFLLPAISMRLISEEIRTGTLETVMTAPVRDAAVILGKWLGAIGFLIAILSPLLVLVVVLEATADPDYGPIFTGLFGLLLAGGFFLAIGVFASTLTENQIIAFIITVFTIGLFTIIMVILEQQQIFDIQTRETIFYLNASRHYSRFNRGVIDTADVVYFLSGIGLFLFLAVKMLESRRWR